jgi:uncharacterized membrane protein
MTKQVESLHRLFIDLNTNFYMEKGGSVITFLIVFLSNFISWEGSTGTSIRGPESQEVAVNLGRDP